MAFSGKEFTLEVWPPRRPMERPFSWHAPSESRGVYLSTKASVAVDPQKQAKMLAQFLLFRFRYTEHNGA